MAGFGSFSLLAGRTRREGSHSGGWETARRLINKRLGEIATGEYLGIEAVKFTVGNLIDLPAEDYRFRKLRSLAIVEWRAKAHLEQLRRLPASKSNAVEVERCGAARRATGAEDSTINRELNIIRRGFTWRSRANLPSCTGCHISRSWRKTTSAMDSLSQDEKVPVELPQRLRALSVCVYHVGTRKGESRKVQSQVRFRCRFIHLTARQTKGKAARSLPIPIYNEMWLREQWESGAPGCPWVFHHRAMPVAAQLRVGAKPASGPV